jgi:hypothetical protein
MALLVLSRKLLASVVRASAEVVASTRVAAVVACEAWSVASCKQNVSVMGGYNYVKLTDESKLRLGKAVIVGDSLGHLELEGGS